jgi:hypothetical protein
MTRRLSTDSTTHMGGARDTQIQENKRRPDGAFMFLDTLDYTLCKKQ